VTDSYPDWPFYDSGLLDELFVQLGSVTLAGGASRFYHGRSRGNGRLRRYLDRMRG